MKCSTSLAYILLICLYNSAVYSFTSPGRRSAALKHSTSLSPISKNCNDNLISLRLYVQHEDDIERSAVDIIPSLMEGQDELANTDTSISRRSAIQTTSMAVASLLLFSQTTQTIASAQDNDTLEQLTLGKASWNDNTIQPTQSIPLSTIFL